MLITNLKTNEVLYGVHAEPITVEWLSKVKDLGGKKVLSREPAPQMTQVVLRQSNGTNQALLLLSQQSRGVELKVTLQETDGVDMEDTWDINLRDLVPTSFSASDDDWELVLQTLTLPDYVALK